MSSIPGGRPLSGPGSNAKESCMSPRARDLAVSSSHNIPSSLQRYYQRYEGPRPRRASPRPPSSLASFKLPLPSPLHLPPVTGAPKVLMTFACSPPPAPPLTEGAFWEPAGGGGALGVMPRKSQRRKGAIPKGRLPGPVLRNLRRRFMGRRDHE